MIRLGFRAHVLSKLDQIEKTLNSLVSLIETSSSVTNKAGVKIMAELKDLEAKQDELVTKLQAESDTITSIETLVKGQTDLIKDLKDQIGTVPGVPQEVLDKMDAAIAQAQNNEDRLVAATIFATPADHQTS